MVAAATGPSCAPGWPRWPPDSPHPAVITGSAPAARAEPVFVFPGQGGQWAGMGRELLASSPVFAARIGRVRGALAPYIGLVRWTTCSPLTGRRRRGLDRLPTWSSRCCGR